MSGPPPGSRRALITALEDAPLLCPSCPADEFSVSWNVWKRRFRVVIWHVEGCPVPGQDSRGRERYAARRYLAAVLARPRELAPVYARHLADA